MILCSTDKDTVRILCTVSAHVQCAHIEDYKTKGRSDDGKVVRGNEHVFANTGASTLRKESRSLCKIFL